MAGNTGNAQSLIDWFNDGADGAISWCSPGDFEDCVQVASAHLDNPEGFCNERHQDVCGGAPGSEGASTEGQVFAMTKDERTKAANRGAAMPDGSFPITQCEGENSVESAKGLARTDAQRAHTIKRAKSLGCAGKIPDNWNSDGSLKGGSASAVGGMLSVVADRDTILADWFSGRLTAAGGPPAPDGSPPAEPAPAGPDPAKPFEPKPYDPSLEQEGGGGVKCPNCQKANDPDAIYCDQCGTKLQGATGVEPFAAGQFAPPPPPFPGRGGGAKPTPPPSGGQVPQGDVDNNEVCATPGCGHMASAHNDTPTGVNTGECAMANCSCGGMTTGAPASKPAQQPGPDVTAGGGAASASWTRLAEGDPPAEAGPPSSPSEGSGGPPTDTNTEASPGPLQGAPFTIPVGVIENLLTSDRRMIAPSAITWRTPPAPLMGLDKTTEQHNDAVLCGVIEAFSRSGSTISAHGHFLATEDGEHFTDLLNQMGQMGVSADISNVVSEIMVGDPSGDEVGPFDGYDLDIVPIGQEVMLITQGELMGFTIVPHPAFAGAFIVLGDGNVDPNAGIAMQQPTPEQAAAGIHIVTSEDCAPCAGGAVVASGAAPDAPPRAWFDRPEPDHLTPFTVLDTGECFGHLAPWGECHTGFQGECVLAPRSRSNYADFHTGCVKTAEGQDVPVGPVTMGTGHASQDPWVTPAMAVAHYDNTGMAVADVHVADGKFGIWMSGALRPWVTEEQIRTLRASAPSGDWRERPGRGMELFAALIVNRPGFPITRAVAADGHLRSLVAAGVQAMAALRQPSTALETEPMTADQRLDRLLRLTERALLPQVRDGYRARMAAVRGRA